VLILRLKRCERALAGGRLDEAARLLQPADARAHRRGQELLDRLVVALVKRGRGHLDGGRLAPAEADWHEAARLAGNLPELAELRSGIDRMAEERRRDQDGRRQAVAAVQEMVRHGQLTLAGDAARSEAIGDGGAGPIVAEIAVRRAASERLEADVEAALEAGDWEAAVQHLGGAGSLASRGGRILRLTRKVGERVAGEVGRMVEAGRTDLAEGVVRRAHPLCAAHGELDAQRRGLEQCRVAWERLAESRFAEAREILERLAALWPRAGWITAGVNELRRAGESVEAVRGGPLGALGFGQTIPYAAPAPQLRPQMERVAPPVVVAAAVAAPRAGTAMRRLLLHVDGAGSYVILQGDRIDVGPVSASRPPDLALLTGAGAPSFTISRSDEDYFVTAGTPLDINERAATSKLLVDGDRIGVGPRCRIEFRRPNAASATAVLRVGGARLPWGGVREAILMDREVVMGASSAAHVRVRECPGAVILQAAQDGLLCRADDVITVDGRAMGRTAKVSEGARVAVGPLSFVVCRE
jgi:hypothetical protein